jgi:serine O-acetyltransferase
MIENFFKQREEAKQLLLDSLSGNSPEMKSVRSDIEQDLQFLFKNDPSVRDISHVNCYTSAFAVAAYRVANTITDDHKARSIAEYAKSLTGVDIHPRAKIGVPFAIDHGVGTVIGETAVIGSNCMLYHGVTLGAKHLNERDQVGSDRHPKLGNNVIIYANTTILGNLQIPEGMMIGANRFIKSQDEIDQLFRHQKALK